MLPRLRVCLESCCLSYGQLIFTVFVIGSYVCRLWVSAPASTQGDRLELFECRAVNQNCTYQFITTMREVKLQDCGRLDAGNGRMRRPTSLGVQMRSLSLRQTQEAGSIFINGVKSIVTTVFCRHCRNQR